MSLEMNAEIVYQVAKALSSEEQKLLLDKLRNDFSNHYTFKKRREKIILNKEEAINYLLETELLLIKEN